MNDDSLCPRFKLQTILMTQQIFAGLKILDLTRIVAGPLCTQNMVDMGATAFKIDRPGKGDGSREMGAKPNVSADQLMQKDKAHWLNQCCEQGVPSGPVYDMEEVFEVPAVLHRNIVVNVPSAGGTMLKLVRNPMRFSRTPVQHRAPPDLGANTRQVLTSALKLTAESIERLKNKAII